jgi:hypothetical protein
MKDSDVSCIFSSCDQILSFLVVKNDHGLLFKKLNELNVSHRIIMTGVRARLESLADTIPTHPHRRR